MISIIIPVYNAAKTLGNMLECIKKQTYTDFEVILIDDGSIDDTGKICDDICKEDLRFRCIHQFNLGVAITRNKGIKEAKGEYIAFLDADDKINDNYFEILFENCKDVDISICDVIMEQNGKERCRFTHFEKKLSQQEALQELLVRRKINSGPCAKLFRREIVADLKFPELKAYEDILFVKDAFCRAKSIKVTDKTAYHYIENPSGAMGNIMKSSLNDVAIATELLLDFILTRTDLDDECFYITVSHLMQYVLAAIDESSTNYIDFLERVQGIYIKYRGKICTNSAFYWKEKIVYIACSFGVVYHNRKVTVIKRR